MKKFFAWILYSSENANKYSLAVKSVAGFIPTFVLFLSLVHVNVEPSSFTGILDVVAAAITAVGSAILAIYTVYGAVRKVVLTFTGSNDVLNRF